MGRVLVFSIVVLFVSSIQPDLWAQGYLRNPPVSPLRGGPGIYASQVIDFDTQGNAGGGIFNPANALGAPVGGGIGLGSLDVHTLGAGGFLTLGFDVLITDGPGADFIVSENPWIVGGVFSFSDAVFVEVSSDGLHFARFPSAYYGPDEQPGVFSGVQIGYYDFLAGALPVLMGSPAFPAANPQDVVEAGGDPFDLADLSYHPLVQKNLVNLNAITQIRLIDVLSGQFLDHWGHTIWDPGFNADIDAVTVIHHTANQSSQSPRVEMIPNVDGTLVVTLSDPDGADDLDLSTLKVATYGVPATDPFSVLEITDRNSSNITLMLLPPFRDEEFMHLKVSIQDFSGNRSGYGRSRPSQKISDCNANAIADFQDIADGTSFDCNLNGQPDECEAPQFLRFSTSNNVDKKQGKKPFEFTVKEAPRTRLQNIEVKARRKPKQSNAGQTFPTYSLAPGFGASVEVIAKELTAGPDGDDFSVRLDYSSNNQPFQEIFQNLDLAVGMSEAILLEEGPLVFNGKSAFPNFDDASATYEARSDSAFAVVFQNGDSFASLLEVRGFGNQLNASCFIAPYINPNTGQIVLSPDALLILFELGTTNLDSPAFDLQDLVILVTPNP